MEYESCPKCWSPMKKTTINSIPVVKCTVCMFFIRTDIKIHFNDGVDTDAGI